MHQKNSKDKRGRLQANMSLGLPDWKKEGKAKPQTLNLGLRGYKDFWGKHSKTHWN